MADPRLIAALMGEQQSPMGSTFAGANPNLAGRVAGPTDTKMNPLDEFAFRQWVKDKNVPFNPDATAPQDYDMRGFYQGLQQGNPRAKSAVNSNDGQMHYPDFWKTPLHQTFSNESQWAGPNAPKWNESDQLTLGPRVLFDERAK